MKFPSTPNFLTHVTGTTRIFWPYSPQVDRIFMLLLMLTELLSRGRLKSAKRTEGMMQQKSNAQSEVTDSHLSATAAATLVSYLFKFQM